MSTQKPLVINDFIKMTERIANGKTNVLNIGSDDTTFYRGEIHLIKMRFKQQDVLIFERLLNL